MNRPIQHWNYSNLQAAQDFWCGLDFFQRSSRS